jgi:hypothetical protein
MFALDYLSFDEDDPHRRHQVVQRHLPDEISGRLGLDGLGRQLADVAVPGVTDVVGECVWFRPARAGEALPIQARAAARPCRRWRPGRA